MKKEDGSQQKDVIKKFLEVYSSKNTIGVYRAALKNYFKTLNIDANHYFKQTRTYEEDVRKFFIGIRDRPPKTVKTYLSGVKIFLSENNIDLSEKFWRGLSRKTNGSRALTMDIVPSNEELKSILTHMDAKGRALFLTLSSSGMRIGETLKLKLDDIELESKPPKVNISGKYTKTGNPRIAFVSTEAKEAIIEWLKVREKYLKAASGKSHKYKKSLEDDHFFPFQDNTALHIWKNAVNKAGMDKRDENTNRYKTHIHVLRKYFRSQMATIIPVDIVEALMGHEGYLTEVYRRYSIKQLGEYYLKGENSITVFRDRNGVKKLREEIKQKNETYDELINRQASKIKRLETELARMEQSKEQQIGNEMIKALQNPEVGKKVLKALEEIQGKQEG